MLHIDSRYPLYPICVLMLLQRPLQSLMRLTQIKFSHKRDTLKSTEITEVVVSEVMLQDQTNSDTNKTTSCKKGNKLLKLSNDKCN